MEIGWLDGAELIAYAEDNEHMGFEGMAPIGDWVESVEYDMAVEWFCKAER